MKTQPGKILAIAIIALFAGASISHAGFGALADMAKKKAAEEANKATEEAKKQATEAASKAGMDALKAGAEALYGDEDVEEEEDVQEAPQKQYQPPQQTQRISPRSAQTAQQVYMLPEEDKHAVSFGIRVGVSYSAYAGFVVDFVATDLFHIQPGLMYLHKEMKMLELPLLLSFKLAEFRFNTGPYFGLCLDNHTAFDVVGLDVGLNTGIGVDIGMFYIGAFYEYAFTDMGSKYGYIDNRTALGLSLGINL